MPMTAMCPSCRKQLSVRDEFIGKRLKCPQCGTTFTADASNAAPAMAGSRAGAAAPRSDRTPKLHLSPGVIIFLIVLVTLPTIFFLWRIGPGRVRAEWARLEPIAADDVKDVVTRGIQAYLSQHGMFDPSKSHRVPQALSIAFIISPMPLTMPDAIGFAGSTSEGAYSGKYNPETGEIEADVEIGGMSIPGGIVAKRGDVKITVTGRNNNGEVTCEVNGKKAELVYPKRLDDDD